MPAIDRDAKYKSRRPRKAGRPRSWGNDGPAAGSNSGTPTWKTPRYPAQKRDRAVTREEPRDGVVPAYTQYRKRARQS
jgi:hypothetical protein